MSGVGNRGGAPVGLLEELGPVEARAVLAFRFWADGPSGREAVLRQFEQGLGKDHGQAAIEAFSALAKLCSRHGRRPLMRHEVGCLCLGADESCFANLIAEAAEGDPEDAMMIATLMVRADMAPCLAALARDVGLALKRMSLRSRKSSANRGATVH